ncbi:class I SAM-dependent methyltransferase [Allorhizocola rhizosphaerae]|uniref:class I SAM-dependent methyltransferase n=1 Tax=Allorhizocola rhizosphaerae TaxID=1872709 RepID=UPI0013C2CB98|nr:class I SAM-dependent methyltransferase [Allorhizocola rhizosphaerae]
MDRKTFMRDVYADYWLQARDKKYGFMDYDRRLCELVESESKPEARLLEVAIGTGYPIAGFLARAGHKVHGIDISPALIERCRELNPGIEASVGDAENLAFDDGTFDAVYCFHSTWYFPDLPRVIDEMLRVTREGGAVLFDIQNRSHPAIAADYERRLRQIRPGVGPRLVLQARNVAKVVLRRGNPNWHAVNYEVPTDPQAVTDHLRQSPAVQNFSVLARNESDQSLARIDDHCTFPHYPRLIFVARR